MRRLKWFTVATAAATALSAVGFLGAARAADTVFYLANSPGRSVEYIFLSDPAHDATGYLESIHVSSSASDANSRTQTFLTRSGDALSFGPYIAARAPDGYTLTETTREGTLQQRHFVRASIQAVNASIAALQVSAARSHALAERAHESRTSRSNDGTAGYAARLAKAEASVNAAQAEYGVARQAADRLAITAREAREEANAELEQSGASLALNASRANAMTRAANAEQDEAVALHRLDLAATAAGSAAVELARLRRLGKGGIERDGPPAAFVTSDEAVAK